MKINVGIFDRGARIVAGLVLLSMLFILDGDIRYIGLLGIVFLATAAARRCPLYSLLGLNTCPIEERPRG